MTTTPKRSKPTGSNDGRADDAGIGMAIPDYRRILTSSLESRDFSYTPTSPIGSW
jgi:hypothetical protein